MERNLKEIILDNRKLIYSVIHRFPGGDYDDLFQAGCLGLINAYKNYHDEYNAKFTTFAYQYILGEVYKCFNNNRNIHMSPENIRLLNALTKANNYLINHLNRYPTDIELANFLEIDLYKLYEIRNMSSIESLDYEYDSENLYNYVYEDKISRDDLIDLKEALKSLSSEEKDFIKARYYESYTQSDLAKKYHTNQVKISREEQKILCKLRKVMN